MFKRIAFFLSVTCCLSISSSYAIDRGTELRDEMWSSIDKDFKVSVIPAKWNGKSAVIISQMHRFEYKKAVLAAVLRVNEYEHYRIMLNDKNAVNKYSEIYYGADNSSRKVYAGIKIIKPDGKEVIIDLKAAVKMEREGYGTRQAYYKIAIPNLEPGDIIDYYICEENDMSIVSVLHFFDPIIHNLPQEYPVMKQKLQFRVQRKCYINLRSLNGAPQLKLVNDEANDEQYYSLDDGDRDDISDTRWLYKNRELPSVKFRAAYARGGVADYFKVLLGKPGEVKESATPSQIADVVKSMVNTPALTKDAGKYLKKYQKNAKTPVEITNATYYYYRNALLGSTESNTVSNEDWGSVSEVRFVNYFHSFLLSKDIAHDIVITVPRNISALDDVLLEQELELLIRVKNGNDYVYYSPMSIYTTPGMINPRIEGNDALVVDGLLGTRKWTTKRVTLPVSKTDENNTLNVMNVTLAADFSKANVAIERTLRGVNKVYAQYELLNVYNAIDEDGKQGIYDPYESFKNMASGTRKKYEAMKDAYLTKREKSLNDDIKKSLEEDYGIKLKEVSNLKIAKTGRYNDDPLVYTVDFTTEELIKKTGPNYIVDIGKLIEQQVKIGPDEMDRKHNIYFDNTRSFTYKITLKIPKGYAVQGLENLNQKIENSTGGFTSSAKEENGSIVIETRKHYDVLNATKDQWKGVVEFLNAANSFTEQKILLKKK